MNFIVATWPREQRVGDDDRVWLEIERAVRELDERRATEERLRARIADLEAPRDK